MKIVEITPFAYSLDYADVYDTFLTEARPEDVREWETASGVTFVEALQDTLDGPNPKWVARVNNEVKLLFGVNPHTEATAHAWMVATTSAVKHQYALHRHHRESLGEMLKGRRGLIAWADSRNAVHLEWMRRMGWQRGGTALLSDEQVPFYQHYYTREMHELCASPALN